MRRRRAGAYSTLISLARLHPFTATWPVNGHVAPHLFCREMVASYALACFCFLPPTALKAGAWVDRVHTPRMQFTFALPNWLSSGAAPGGQPAEAIALRDALVGGDQVDTETLDGWMDALAAKRVPFRPELLGGGLWRASYTRGETPRWEKSQKALAFLNNKAGQIYDVDAKRVSNYGEIAGSAAYFTAEGSFAAVDSPGERRRVSAPAVDASARRWI